MASKQEKQETPTPTPTPLENQLPSNLDGWDDVAAQKGDGWARPEKGAWIQGRLTGRFEMRARNDSGKRRAFYQVKVARFSPGLKMMVGKGENAETIDVTAGCRLNVNETTALEDLSPIATSDGVFDVFIRWLQKEDLGGGSTFWRMEVKKKTIRPPSPVQVGTRRAENDDIPF